MWLNEYDMITNYSFLPYGRALYDFPLSLTNDSET